MDLLVGRSVAELNRIRDRFGDGSGTGLGVEDFVDLLLPGFRDTELSPVEKRNKIVKLFRNIDSNDHSKITWEDFTMFAIEDKLAASKCLPHEAIRSYKCKRVVEERDAIQNMTYIQSWDKLVLQTKNYPYIILNPNDWSQHAMLHSRHFHGAPITCEWIPQHRWFVTSSADMYIRCFDDMFHLKTVALTDKSHLVVKWQETPGVLYSGTRDGEVVEWDILKSVSASAGPQIKASRRIPLHTKPIMDMLFLPHIQSRMITCSLDSKILLHDLERHQTVQMGAHTTGVTKLSYSEHYQFLLSCGYELHALAWISNVPGHKPYTLEDMTNPHKHPLVGVHAVVKTPQVVTADQSGMVKIWDIRMFKCVHTFSIGDNATEDLETNQKPTYSSTVTHFTYLDNFQQILIPNWRKIYIHEYDEGHDPTVADDIGIKIVKFNATANCIMTVSGRDVRVWDVTKGCLTNHFQNIASSDITALCLDQFGRRFFLGTHQGHIAVHRFRDAHKIMDAPPHKGEVTSLQLWHGRALALSSSMDGRVHIFSDHEDSENPYFIKITINNYDILCGTFSRNLSLFLFGNLQSQIFAFDPNSPRRIVHDFQTSDGEVVALCFLDPLSAFCAAYSNGKIRIWTTRPFQFKGEPQTICLAWWYNNPQNHHRRWCKQMQNGAGLEEEVEDSPEPKIGMSGSASSLGSYLRQVQFEAPEAQGNTNTDWDFYAGTEGQSEGPVESPIQERPKTPPKAYRPIVTCMVWDEITHDLYTGDELGTLTRWSLCPVLQPAKLVPTAYPPPSDIFALSKLNTLMEIPAASKVSPHIRVLRSWKAHEDEMTSIIFLEAAKNLITSGEDCRVIIWTLDGIKVSELAQGRLYPDGYGIAAREGDTEEPQSPTRLEAITTSDAHQLYLDQGGPLDVTRGQTGIFNLHDAEKASKPADQSPTNYLLRRVIINSITQHECRHDLNPENDPETFSSPFLSREDKIKIAMGLMVAARSSSSSSDSSDDTTLHKDRKTRRKTYHNVNPESGGGHDRKLQAIKQRALRRRNTYIALPAGADKAENVVPELANTSSMPLARHTSVKRMYKAAANLAAHINGLHDSISQSSDFRNSPAYSAPFVLSPRGAIQPSEYNSDSPTSVSAKSVLNSSFIMGASFATNTSFAEGVPHHSGPSARPTCKLPAGVPSSSAIPNPATIPARRPPGDPNQLSQGTNPNLNLLRNYGDATPPQKGKENVVMIKEGVIYADRGRKSFNITATTRDSHERQSARDLNANINEGGSSTPSVDFNSRQHSFKLTKRPVPSGGFPSTMPPKPVLSPRGSQHHTAEGASLGAVGWSIPLSSVAQETAGPSEAPTSQLNGDALTGQHPSADTQDDSNMPNDQDAREGTTPRPFSPDPQVDPNGMKDVDGIMNYDADFEYVESSGESDVEPVGAGVDKRFSSSVATGGSVVFSAYGQHEHKTVQKRDPKNFIQKSSPINAMRMYSGGSCFALGGLTMKGHRGFTCPPTDRKKRKKHRGQKLNQQGMPDSSFNVNRPQPPPHGKDEAPRQRRSLTESWEISRKLSASHTMEAPTSLPLIPAVPRTLAPQNIYQRSSHAAPGWKQNTSVSTVSMSTFKATRMVDGV